MAGAAYAVSRIDSDVWVLVKACDKRRVVTAHVMAYKAVKLSGYIMFI